MTQAKIKNARKKSGGLNFDITLLVVVIILLVFGLLMVYSASWDYALQTGHESTYYFNRQLIWVALGVIMAVITTFVNYHWYEKILLPLGVGTILLLLAVLIVNRDSTDDLTRMLIGNSIQPTELAKAVLIVYLSFWLYKRREYLNDREVAFVPLAVILGITFGLVNLQGDLSAGLTVLMLGGILFFMAGGDGKIIFKMLLFVLSIGVPTVLIYPKGRNRIISFIESIMDPMQSSYQIQRALEAVARGGWVGVGIGNATTKFTGLPLPPTDSIFAVIAEETGIIGAVGLLTLYGIFIWRGLKTAKEAPDELGSLIAFGLTTWITMEAIMNIASMLGLLPVLGNALPFISLGGSNMIVTMTSVGIIMNISRMSIQKNTKERSAHSAVVNLRRWNGRRRVSGDNRS